MNKSLATLVKTIATNYAGVIKDQRFNGLAPKALHARALRQAADVATRDCNETSGDSTPNSK